MKILFIHNTYRQTGGEDVAVDLESKLLMEKGHQVRTLYFDNKSIRGFFSAWLTAIRSVYNLSSARKLTEAVRKFQPDVIHVHNLFLVASPSVLYRAAKEKIPVVLTLHNYRLICANALLLRNGSICELCIQKKIPLHGIRYRCYRNSRVKTFIITAITSIHKMLRTWKKRVGVYITLNEFSKNKFLHSSLDLPEDKIITKPNFVPDPGGGIYPRENFFLFAGRIVPEKGVHVLLSAFEKMPAHQLIIAGDGPEKETLVQQYKPFRNIRFAGHLSKPELYDLMKRCRAFICPSIWYEGSPLTIIEAFANGSPVLASHLGAMAESIRDGYNGFHFQAGNPEDLRAKTELLFTLTGTGSDLYTNARQTYLEKYHPDIHYREIISIYESAIKKMHG